MLLLGKRPADSEKARLPATSQARLFDMGKRVRLFVFLGIAATVAACEINKTESPLSPSVAGPIAGVEISAPKLLEPVSGAVIAGDRQPITLLIENASSTGQRPLNYAFEVASDAGFSNLAFTQEGITPGANGRTELTLSTALATGRSYYWRAKAQDGANAGPYSATMGFNVFTPVVFDKPIAISPVGGAKVTSSTPEFVFSNAARTGSPGLVTYVIEVASNSAFAGILAAWQFTEQPGQTRFTAPSALPSGALLYWHVRAFESTLGPWSDTSTFTTPTPSIPNTGGGGSTGSSCTNALTQLAVVQCRRGQVTGHMDASQMLTFLRNVAADINKAGTWGAGYGLLRKSGGASCGGYSCDIICQGNGSSQRQWDVLGDVDNSQVPTWNGPSISPNIRVDACE